ncbi:MAG TPA: aminotransferase class IV [Coriobacteriia bacterium]|nr:aminotransferase class IV [Coriobacteriia bacterium]
MTRYMYLNGTILLEEQAHISPLDIGLLRGYAVFDLLRTVGGRPFLLDEHLERLHTSARQLGLQVPARDEEIARAIDELLERNGHEEATVRLVLTGGVSPDGMAYDPATPTFFILTHDLHEPAPELYERGGRLVTELHHRELPKAKTTNYLTMLRNKPRTAAAGALDVLYHDGTLVSETGSASFYIVSAGCIRAPHKDVLRGTVGDLVLRLVAGRYQIELGELRLDEVFAADEAFVTSTTRGVLPIVEIDGQTIGDGQVGPVTRELMAIWARHAFGEGGTQR